MSFYHVHFDDEAPRIGSGWRVVYLEHDGRKWVRLRCPFSGVSVSLSRTVWLKVAATARPAHLSAAAVRTALKTRARATGQKITGPQKAMIAAAREARPEARP